MVMKMLGFENMALTIEHCIEKDIRGIPKYSEPITVQGYAVEKTTYNYQTGKTSKYIFATLADSDLVKADDRLNGYRVETVKNVYIDGEFIVCEVTAV